FAMLEAAGLEIERLPARDHARYAQAPWTSETREVVTTEKDAVKLAALPASALHGARVWVVPLDCDLPDALVHALVALLALPARSPRREETSR
ncbi:MAG: tetraacyldisaccharide 4'-kinase, partial [Burkholderiaceae bacterium]|nr:tetraacyldisaccharide 4'-kinase [Burkholderiaceae bacterium]